MIKRILELMHFQRRLLKSLKREDCGEIVILLIGKIHRNNAYYH